MNKYLAQLADMAWGNVAIISVVAAVVYYFLMFDDGSSLKQQIEQGKVRLSEAKQQLAQTEKAMQDANRFEREVLETARQFESIVDYMPLSMSAADLHAIITKNASLAGVRVSRLEPKGPDTPNGFYQTTKMKMELEGTFAQIVSFLANLSRAPNLLTLEETELKTGKSTDGGPSLLFNGVLVGYRYLKDADVANDTKNAGKPGSKQPPPPPKKGGKK